MFAASSNLVQLVGLGATDWHVVDTATVISNLRRQGKTDAQITAYLLLPDDTANPPCPGGCTQKLVNDAFQYLATGAPSTKPGWLKPALIGGGILAAGIAVVAIARHR